MIINLTEGRLCVCMAQFIGYTYHALFLFQLPTQRTGMVYVLEYTHADLASIEKWICNCHFAHWSLRSLIKAKNPVRYLLVNLPQPWKMIGVVLSVHLEWLERHPQSLRLQESTWSVLDSWTSKLYSVIQYTALLHERDTLIHEYPISR